MEVYPSLALMILAVVAMGLAYMQSILAGKALEAMQGLILELRSARDKISQLEDEICLMHKELSDLIEEADASSADSDDGSLQDWEMN